MEESDNNIKMAEPKVERLTSQGVEVEKTTYPDGRERVVVLSKDSPKPKVKSPNPKKDE